MINPKKPDTIKIYATMFGLDVSGNIMWSFHSSPPLTCCLAITCEVTDEAWKEYMDSLVVENQKEWHV